MATPRRGEVDPSPPHPVQTPIWPEAIMKPRAFHTTLYESETEIERTGCCPHAAWSQDYLLSKCH